MAPWVAVSIPLSLVLRGTEGAANRRYCCVWFHEYHREEGGVRCSYNRSRLVTTGSARPLEHVTTFIWAVFLLHVEVLQL